MRHDVGRVAAAGVSLPRERLSAVAGRWFGRNPCGKEQAVQVRAKWRQGRQERTPSQKATGRRTLCGSLFKRISSFLPVSWFPFLPFAKNALSNQSTKWCWQQASLFKITSSSLQHRGIVLLLLWWPPTSAITYPVTSRDIATAHSSSAGVFFRQLGSYILIGPCVYIKSRIDL